MKETALISSMSDKNTTWVSECVKFCLPSKKCDILLFDWDNMEERKRKSQVDIGGRKKSNINSLFKEFIQRRKPRRFQSSSRKHRNMTLLVHSRAPAFAE